MKRLLSIILTLLTALATMAGNACHTSTFRSENVEEIYKGPRQIGDWDAIELTSIKFHNLQLGDTIYVYASGITPQSKGAFQNHNWHTLAPDILNGQTINGDFEMIVHTQEVLDELKRYGLKVRGCHYVLNRVVIKHTDNQIRTIITTATCIVLLVVIVAFALLLRKNRQLARANRSIYKANLNVIAAADRERQMRTRYEGEIAAYREMMQAQNKKYQNSTLGDDDKAALTDRILKVFENGEEIFESNFDMNRLAELVGSTYKNVSQTVNEQLGKNFNQVLNEYRIKEACRRLNDQATYGNYTIEAIGESVGYGSRSTFVTQFKTLTGLTPSEFQNQARNKMA